MNKVAQIYVSASWLLEMFQYHPPPPVLILIQIALTMVVCYQLGFEAPYPTDTQY